MLYLHHPENTPVKQTTIDYMITLDDFQRGFLLVFLVENITAFLVFHDNDLEQITLQKKKKLNSLLLFR